MSILISGRGSNMRALLEDSRDPNSPYAVTLVVSDQPAAAGLGVAQDFGVANRVVPVDRRLDRASYDRGLSAVLDQATPDLIVLAGFMRILSPQFVERYAGRILNIHPSLLPLYPGLHTHRKVLAAHDTVHGATVHFVNAELDGGPAIIQGLVTVAAGDDEATLAARVQRVEHRIYPQAVRWFSEGRLRCDGQRAWLDGAPLTAPIVDTVTLR